MENYLTINSEISVKNLRKWMYVHHSDVKTVVCPVNDDWHVVVTANPDELMGKENIRAYMPPRDDSAFFETSTRRGYHTKEEAEEAAKYFASYICKQWRVG